MSSQGTQLIEPSISDNQLLQSGFLIGFLSPRAMELRVSGRFTLLTSKHFRGFLQ